MPKSACEIALADGKAQMIGFATLNLESIKEAREAKWKVESAIHEMINLRQQEVKRYEANQISKKELDKRVKSIWSKTQELLQLHADLPDYKSLGAIAKQDHEQAIDLVFVVLGWFQAQLSITQLMNDEQRLTASIDIVEAHKDILLEELVVILRSAIRGEFGDMYNRIDVAVLHKWIKTWKERKIEAAIKRSQDAHANLASPEREPESNELRDTVNRLEQFAHTLREMKAAFNTQRQLNQKS